MAEQQKSAVPQGNYSGKIVVDPITRIEGHLRIEVEVEKGRVKNAYSSATMFRGLEIILKGRDPQDAQHFAQRTCGVCTYTHALASTRCVENAVGVKIPKNANYIRNLVLGQQYLHDHIVHFYVLHALDFVDVTAALKADPAKAAKIASGISPRKTKAEDLKAVQAAVQKLVDSGQLGPFTNAYFLGGHPAYKLDPEVNLIATAHYLEALRLQVKAARAMAVLGAKNPHTQFTVVGGVTSYESLTQPRIKEFTDLWKETKDFVDQVYIPDLLAVGAAYKDCGEYGGTTNFITFGEYASEPDKAASFYYPAGVIKGRDISKVEDFNPEKIAEHVRHSWFEGGEAHHPYDGVTDPKYTDLHGDERYSWSKAPRYMDEPMETGPLAQMLVAYAKGHKEVKASVDSVLKALGLPVTALFSTLGRTAARGIETAVTAAAMDQWLKSYQDNVAKDKDMVAEWTMPKEGKGVGFVNAPRGGLSHWINIADGKIANYQLVVPSTWCFGPRDAKNKLGPVEESLIGTPIADAKRPVEILRTVHSFDPCLACAVHVIDPESNEERVFKVL